jgi:hypothetical protein
MQWLALSNIGFALILPAILVLYLLKRKVEDQPVPSTLLWQRALQNREAVRPWEKLRRNLLLLLQLLAALLLVLALMRPAVPTEGVSDPHTILVIEQSASMLAREGDETRFARAVQTAKQLVEGLGSGQTVTLIEAGREPRVRIAQSGDRQALLRELQALVPQAGRSDTAAAMSLAAAISADRPGSGVIWLGDGRTEGFDPAALPAISGSFRFMQMGTLRENTALAVFATQPADTGVEALLRIDNKGTRTSSGSAAIYDEANNLLDAGRFSVEAGESQALTFSALPDSPVYRAVIEPDEPAQDGLVEDNQRWSVPFTAGVGKAVLVSLEGNRFLHQALQTAGRLEVEIRQNPPGQEEEARDLWVFDGLVPERLPEGNVLLIAPDRGAEWLPYSGTRELDRQPQAIAPDSPLLKYVDWADVHVAKTSVLGEMAGMETLVRAGGEDLVRAGTIDGRRIVIVAFDLHDSDMPLRPAFPIFMQNAFSWLAPAQAAPIGSASPGDQLDIPLAGGAKNRVLIQPDGQRQELVVQGTRFLYQVPDRIGLYRLQEEFETGVQTRYFAVHPDERESDIAPSGVSAAAQAKDQETPPDAPAGRREWTGWLAALGLLIVFAEWRVYQRGY